jgi:glycosyltransferase
MTSSAQSIGIVIASFNDNRIIHTITSIKAADPHRVSRIYVMDAGSRPAVVDAIKLVLRPHDVLVSERDAGIYDGINKGLDRVKEEFVGWLGSDDFFTQNVNFDEILSRFALGHLDCLIFDIAFIDDYGVARRSLAHAPTPNNYLLGKLVLHYSSFWRRSTIGTLRFDLQFPVAADQDFFLQLVSQKKLAYEIDNRVGTVMRLGGASTGGTARILSANRETFHVYKKYMGAPLAALAVAIKLLRKIVWKLTASRYPILKEFTNSMLFAVAGDKANSPK